MMYRLATKTQRRKRTAEITSLLDYGQASRKRMCEASTTVCKQKVLPAQTNSKLSSAIALLSDSYV